MDFGSRKAKTAKADSSGFKLAGLIASPITHPSAFDITRNFLDNWRDLNARLVEVGSGFSLNQSRASEHYGCVKLGEDYLYGDFDLYDVIFNRDSRGKKSTQEELPSTFPLTSYQQPPKKGFGSSRGMGAVWRTLGR